jgi:hypothetical protein
MRCGLRRMVGMWLELHLKSLDLVHGGSSGALESFYSDFEGKMSSAKSELLANKKMESPNSKMLTKSSALFSSVRLEKTEPPSETRYARPTNHTNEALAFANNQSPISAHPVRAYSRAGSASRKLSYCVRGSILCAHSIGKNQRKIPVKISVMPPKTEAWVMLLLSGNTE